MIITPENDLKYAADTTPKTVFLAGSINEGKSFNWQKLLTKYIKDRVQGAWIFNPRREDWNPNWEDRFHNEIFRKQVEWEIHHLSKAKNIFFYFVGGEHFSPISLYELGWVQGKDKNVIVYSDDHYARYRNLEVYGALDHFKLYSNLEEAKKELFKNMNKDDET